MKQLFILLFILTQALAYAQSTPMAFEDWKTTAGTQNFFYKNVTKTDASNNVYVAGATLNSAGNTDILLAKYSPNGVQLWIRQYAGAGNGTDFAAGLVVTSTDVYVTGAVTTSTASPTTDAITMRYTSAGVFQWATTYNGTGNLHDAGKHIVLDASGNVYSSGGSYNASGNTDFLTLKYSSAGVQQWVKTYDYSAGLDDAAIKVATNGSNVIVTGAVTSSTGNYKFATLTYAQSTGSLTATSISTAVTTASVDVVADLATDGAGNVYVVGSTIVTGQGSNYYVQKLSTTLVSAWTYTFNGASSLNDIAKGVQVDASGNVFITGYSTSSTEGRNIATIKLNSSGVQQWVQYYNDPSNKDDEAADLIVDASANVYITGYNTNTLNKTDYYTIKYNSSGTKQWDVITDGGAALNDNATNITLDSLNNVIITGQSETAPSTFNFLTVKYVQYDVITPVDFGSSTEPFSLSSLYYPNTGEVRDTSWNKINDVLYYTKHTSPQEYVFANKMAFSLVKETNVSGSIIDTIVRVDMVLNQASTKAKAYPIDVQNTGVLNYLLPYMGATGKLNVKGASRLIVPNIYPNIDLHYYSNGKGLKYYFVVKPGGNPNQISITFNGASTTTLSASNEITVVTKLGNFAFKKPDIYNLNGLLTPTVTGTNGWVNSGSNTYTVNVGTYNTTLPLIIEVDRGKALGITSSTANLTWSTYYGGISNDAITDIKNDVSNNLYIVGSSKSNALPQGFGVSAASVYQAGNKGLYDGFVAKFDANGVLKWETFVGGNGDDEFRSFDIANGGTGDLYCVGRTKSTDLMYVAKAGATLVNQSTHAAGANYDGFIFQLGQNGSTNNWLTYYGGTGVDNFFKCKFDGLGNLFIAGASSSPSLNVVGTGSQYTSPYIDISGATDAYVCKLNNSTFNIDWATYAGSSSTVAGSCSTDNYYAMDFDGSNDLYIGGMASGNNYPIVYSAGSTTLASAGTMCLGNAIITRFSNNGAMLWSTYFGGNNSDYVLCIKTTQNEVYVGGLTDGITTFPTLNSSSYYYNTTKTSAVTGAYQEGGFFACFNKVNKAIHSTLIGGANGDDRVTDIQIDKYNKIYLFGNSSSSTLDIPVGGNPAGLWSKNNSGANDEYILTLEKGNTSPLWSTQVGGDMQELGDSHGTIDGNDNLFISSSAQSQVTFPWNDGGGFPVHYQNSLTGPAWYDYDGCITRFKITPSTFVGVKENSNKANEVSIFPNPTQNSITIKLTDITDKKTYCIYNTMGQLMSSGSLTSSTTTINVADLSNGIYFIEILSKDSKTTTKFIKQ